MIALAAALLLQVPIPVRILPPDTTLPRVTLAEAIRLSTGVDPAYVRAAGRVDNAEWGRRAAVLAFIIPSLAVSLDATRYSTAFFNIGIGAPTSNAVNFRANAVYELLSVRKITDLGFTKAELEATQANAERQRFQTAFDTESDFLNVLISRELARVAHSRYERAQEQLTVARARVLSGAAVQTDSLQLVLELTQARVDVLRQDLSLRVSRLQLGRRIGRDGPVDAQVTDSMLPPDLPYTDQQLIQLALQQAPQYREARSLARSASYSLKGQKGAYLPTFNLTGGFTEYDSRFPPSGQGVGSISLIVTWPLWDRGQREIAVQQAKTNLAVARAVSADLERSAARDVTQAAEAYRISREAVDLTQVQLVAAQETFRVQDLRYKSGANTILDLLEAQFQLTRAESEAVQSVFALYLSLAGLEAITGQEFLVRRNQ
ncbi:MAG: outer rane macrolide efflux protein [Gemmatimonadetes bacterium]|nr:outer rane macrolide efflux protein [Gemmatimonadota bacterium]